MTAPSPEFAELAAALDGQYALEREIGRGGMGLVYLARDEKLHRRVAIKTLPRSLSDSATRDRFLREARTAASLSHPNIVPIYRADEVGGFVYFAMAYVEGESLAERVRSRGPLEAREAAGYLRDVALALGYAHAHGVIHRDVKAENILLDRETGRAMVTDFGIARVADAAPLTQTGHVLGTVHYMSPEQVAGEKLDGRTDLYALGVVGYLALSGAFPFDSETASAVLVAHVTKRAPALRSVAPHAPPSLAAVIDRCLSREASARFGTGEEVATALERALASSELATEGAAPRALSEAQAQAVWRRASELQALTGVQKPPPVEPPPATTEAAGTSAFPMSVVKASALEAGISERFVAKALVDLGLASGAAPLPVPASEAGGLATVESRSPTVGFWAGAPMFAAFEAKVDGEIHEDEYDLLVETIRRQLGDVGQVSTLGRSLAWTATNVRRRIAITVMPRGGRTTIRVEERYSQLAGGLFGGIVGGGGGGFGGASIGIVAGATHSFIAAILAAGGIVVSAYGLARTIFKSTVRAHSEELRLLTAQLADTVSDAVKGSRR